MLGSTLQQSVSMDARWGGHERLEEIADEWRGLCAEGPNDEPFYRPEWIAAYLHAFVPPKRVLLLEARVDGKLKAVLPLVAQHFGKGPFRFRTLVGAANIHSCRFDLIRGAGSEGSAAVASIWSALKDRTDWDSIELPRVPCAGGAEQLLSLARQDGYLTGQWPSNSTPYIQFDCRTVDDPSSLARHAHFRQNLRRRIRKAENTGSLTLRKV
ncbi:MAG TPA: hypothetical protein VN428_17435, partial [Bryobacteraceae bacterium]|nr:hypothetical protein [Bryobacteraceae bacterium]